MRKTKIVAAVAAISLLWMGSSAVLADSVQSPEFVEFEEIEPEKSYEFDMGSSDNAPVVDGTILKNVYLGAYDFSGMTRDEASAFVETHIDELTGHSITLLMDELEVTLSAAELGVLCDYEPSIDEALQYGQTGNVFGRYKIQQDLKQEQAQLGFSYKVDEEVLREVLEEQCEPLNREFMEFDLLRKNGNFVIVDGQSGISLKLEESVQKLSTYFVEKWKAGNARISLVADIQQPKGSREELSRVKDLLGSGSTKYGSSNPNRKANIETGVSKIRGTVLYPGESFSVCDALVPFSEENGYYPAASYANGTTVDSLGGGVCQVSTTFYLALLRAELQIDKRYNHSMTIGYADLAMDAAIAEGSKDLIFSNNLDAPIYVHAYADGSTVYFAIYGEEYRDENRSVRYESETVETTEPAIEITRNYNLPLGKVQKHQSPQTGYYAKLWKITTVDGEETKELVNTSYYVSAPGKYTVGMKTSNKEASDAMWEATEAKDIQKVYQVINTYGSEE